MKFENNVPPLLNLTLKLTDSEANLGEKAFAEAAIPY